MGILTMDNGRRELRMASALMFAYQRLILVSGIGVWHRVEVKRRQYLEIHTKGYGKMADHTAVVFIFQLAWVLVRETGSMG